jgi:hypothetical protein
MIGNEKKRIGLMKLVKPKPELNQIIISLSLNHLLNVNRIVKKSVRVSKIGRYFSKLKTNIVSMESLGIIPFDASRKTITPR